MSAHLLALALGLLLDRLVGDPPSIWRRVPHPVVLFGNAIAALDRRWNRDGDAHRRREALGLAAIVLLLGATSARGLARDRRFAAHGGFGAGTEALIVAIFLAQKSLADHVESVAGALETRGLEAGRGAVSMIVGRDLEGLDAAGVSRAAIESLAENASDGVVAPALTFLLFGLPGLLAYKMLNTADSMIGHLSTRHRAFGRAAAQLDDVANWVPARLTAALFALLGPHPRAAFSAALEGGPRHRSPNAGWPEAAMAGALGLALGGPRRYGEIEVDAPMLNAGGRREAGPADIRRALELFRRLCNALLVLVLAALAVSLP